MKKLLTISVLVTACLVLASAAQAAVSKGTKEVAIFGSIINTAPEVGPETTTVILQASGGLFITDALQLGGSAQQVSITNGFTATVRILNAFAKFHLNPADEVVPYVGGQGGVAFIEADGVSDSGVSYGGMAGVKFFLSEDLSANAEANLLFSTIADVDTTQTSFLVGFSYYF